MEKNDGENDGENLFLSDGGAKFSPQMKKKVLQDKLLESSRCINPKIHRGMGGDGKTREKNRITFFPSHFSLSKKYCIFATKLIAKNRCNLLMIK